MHKYTHIGSSLEEKAEHNISVLPEFHKQNILEQRAGEGRGEWERMVEKM